MLFNELPTAFPWYQKKEYQNRFRQNVSGRYDLLGGYKPIDLLCPYDAILPFEFYLPEPINSNIAPFTWGIYRSEDDSFVQTLNVNQIDRTYLPGVNRKYFYHDGRQQNIHLGIGSYYSVLEFPNGFKQFSEVFQVCDFSVNQLDCPFLKLEWYNDSDLDPIFYNDKVNGKPRFRNILYLDTFIHEYRPTIEVETTPGGPGVAIPIETIARLPYAIAVCVPAYLNKALVHAQMNDHIFITTAGIEHRTGELQKYNTETEQLLGGVFANITITFEEILVVKTSCANNMV